MVRRWNAEAYDRVSDPQFNWGLKVLGRLQLRGDETVLDAGCGTGRLTRVLLEKLPRGRVLAVDASAEMAARAAENLAEFGTRIEVRQNDVCELHLAGAVDAILSTATFHWIPERDRLFRSLGRALRPGGWLVAQCGGANSLDRFWSIVGEIVSREPYAAFVQGRRKLQEYLAPDITSRQLSAAGFTDVKVWTEELPVRFPSGKRFGEFITTVNLAEHLKYLPSDLQPRFIDEVVTRYERTDPPLTLDYVRLNMDARKQRSTSAG